MADRIIFPRVMYDNAFYNNTVTSTAASPDGTLDSEAFDWLDWTFRTVDATTTFECDATADGTYAGAGFYLLPDDTWNGTVAVQIETGLGTGTYTTVASVTPTAGQEALSLSTYPDVAVVTGQKVRVVVTVTAGSIKLRNVAAGPVLVSPIGQKEGINRASFHGQNRYGQKATINGSLLGRQVIRQEKSQQIMWDLLSDSFLEVDWSPFAREAELHAFYYAWDNDRFPDEVSFAFAEEVDTPTNMGNPNRRKVEMQLRVLVVQK